MRKVLLVLVILSLAGAARAQTLTQPVNPLHKTSTAAPTDGCSDGEINVDTVAKKVYFCAGGWQELVTGGSLPSGLITFVTSGSCGAGWSEVTALNGVTLVGTLVANSDVGTTGGSDSVTPTVASLTAAAQTVSSLTAAAQTVNSLSAAAQTFTGDSTTVPAETVNSLTAAAQTVNSLTAAAHTISWPPGVPTQAADTFGTTKFTTSGSGTAGFTSETARGAISWPPGVPTEGTSAVTGTMNSSAVTGTLNSTTVTPLGHNAASAVTGTMNSSAVTGTMNSSAVTGSLSSFDNRSAFVKVIFCSKN